MPTILLLIILLHLDCIQFDVASILGQPNIPDDVKYQLILIGS